MNENQMAEALLAKDMGFKTYSKKNRCALAEWGVFRIRLDFTTGMVIAQILSWNGKVHTERKFEVDQFNNCKEIITFMSRF